MKEGCLRANIGRTVNTLHGRGRVVGIDLEGHDERVQRYVVELDDSSRFGWNPCYWPEELE